MAEIGATFLKIGATAFGGPAVHVAVMRDELVVRRQWVNEQDFLDGLGVTSVLPGPGSTQLSMLLGRRRAGVAGMVVAGVSFITPAFLLVLALAWAYTHYGHSVFGAGVLYGIAPVVIAVVANALWGLSRATVRGVVPWALAVAAFGAYLAGVDVLILLLGAGLLCTLARNGPALASRGRTAVLMPWIGAASSAVLAHGTRPRIGAIFFEFLKLGAVVFGSGYVLLAYGRSDLVVGLGWLTMAKLLDAVAVGQLTPGPVFTTATFIGYLLDGLPGALVATAAIFLPSFFMVALAAPLVARIRRYPWTAAALDGVNAAALGLMAGVGMQLARTAFAGPLAVCVAVGAAGVLFWGKVNSMWVVLAGAAIGVLHALV